MQVAAAAGTVEIIGKDMLHDALEMGGQGFQPPLAASTQGRRIDGRGVIIGSVGRHPGQIAQCKMPLVAQNYAGALRAHTEGLLGYTLEQRAQLRILCLKLTRQCRQLLDILRQVTSLRRHAAL